jgi:hypothetical protein
MDKVAFQEGPDGPEASAWEAQLRALLSAGVDWEEVSRRMALASGAELALSTLNKILAQALTMGLMSALGFGVVFSALRFQAGQMGPWTFALGSYCVLALAAVARSWTQAVARSRKLKSGKWQALSGLGVSALAALAGVAAAWTQANVWSAAAACLAVFVLGACAEWALRHGAHGPLRKAADAAARGARSQWLKRLGEGPDCVDSTTLSWDLLRGLDESVGSFRKDELERLALERALRSDASSGQVQGGCALAMQRCAGVLEAGAHGSGWSLRPPLGLQRMDLGQLEALGERCIPQKVAIAKERFELTLVAGAGSRPTRRAPPRL